MDALCIACTSPEFCGQAIGRGLKSICEAESDPTPTPLDTSVAVKQDDGKNRVDLLPIGPLEDIAEILTFGANKYADHNWRKGFKWSRLLGALLRHVFAWSRGEKCDPETGKSHLAHAGCCILFLLEHEKRGLGEDDRYTY